MTTTVAYPNLTAYLTMHANLFALLAGVQVTDGLCCCCPEPRLSVLFGPTTEEWMHVDDETYAEMRHVHVDSSSRDCDGLYDRGDVYRIPSIRPEALRPAYLGGEPSFDDLWMYLLRHEPRMAPGLRLQILGDFTDGRGAVGTVATWNCPTDEGGEGGDMRVCDDPYCAHDERTFRDHTAEAAGY